MNRKRLMLITAGVFLLVVLFLLSRVNVVLVMVDDRSAVTARVIESALELYKADHGEYPRGEKGLDLLVFQADGNPLEKPYMSCAPRDAWNRPFRWSLVDGKPQVTSAGPDGVHDTADDIHSSMRLSCRRRYVLKLW
jgi:hypothetical protein